MITITPMRISDLPDVAEFMPRQPHVAFQPWEHELLGATIAEHPDANWVARTPEGSLIGASIGGSFTTQGTISHVATEADRRCRGLGRQLVSQTLDALRQRGVESVYIITTADNSDGRRFWRTHMNFAPRHGVTLECDLDQAPAAGFPDVHRLTATELSEASAVLNGRLSETQRRTLLAHALQGKTKHCFVGQSGSGINGVLLAASFGVRGWLGPLALRPGQADPELPRRLVLEALRSMHEHGVFRVHVLLSPQELPQRTFYERLGFAEQPGEQTMELALAS